MYCLLLIHLTNELKSRFNLIFQMEILTVFEMGNQIEYTCKAMYIFSYFNILKMNDLV